MEFVSVDSVRFVIDASQSEIDSILAAVEYDKEHLGPYGKEVYIPGHIPMYDKQWSDDISERLNGLSKQSSGQSKRLTVSEYEASYLFAITSDLYRISSLQDDADIPGLPDENVLDALSDFFAEMVSVGKLRER